jgi:hypothetical protein
MLVNIFSYFPQELFALPSDLLCSLLGEQKGEEAKGEKAGWDAQQRTASGERARRSYLSDINPHTFYSVITIIMMMIGKHKTTMEESRRGGRSLCEAYETATGWILVGAYFMVC